LIEKEELDMSATIASNDMSGSVSPIGVGTSNVRGGTAARDDASMDSLGAVTGSTMSLGHNAD
jgi:hypothetical protein